VKDAEDERAGRRQARLFQDPLSVETVAMLPLLSLLKRETDLAGLAGQEAPQ